MREITQRKLRRVGTAKILRSSSGVKRASDTSESRAYTKQRCIQRAIFRGRQRYAEREREKEKVEMTAQRTFRKRQTRGQRHSDTINSGTRSPFFSPFLFPQEKRESVYQCVWLVQGALMTRRAKSGHRERKEGRSTDRNHHHRLFSPLIFSLLSVFLCAVTIILRKRSQHAKTFRAQ